MAQRGQYVGKRLTEEQRDEVFLFRYLLGISAHELEHRVPEWEREVLRERIEAWLPRIIGGAAAVDDVQDAPAPAGGGGLTDLASAPLPLAGLGISTTLIDTSRLPAE